MHLLILWVSESIGCCEGKYCNYTLLILPVYQLYLIYIRLTLFKNVIFAETSYTKTGTHNHYQLQSGNRISPSECKWRETAWAQTITEDCITSVSWQSKKWHTMVSFNSFRWRSVTWLCCLTPGQQWSQDQMLSVNNAQNEAGCWKRSNSDAGLKHYNAAFDQLHKINTEIDIRKETSVICPQPCICFKKERNKKRPAHNFKFLNPGLHWLTII